MTENGNIVIQIEKNTEVCTGCTLDLRSTQKMDFSTAWNNKKLNKNKKLFFLRLGIRRTVSRKN